MSQHLSLVLERLPSSIADRYRATLTLISILAIALLVRLLGIEFSLPYLAHPDEAYLMMPALQMIKTGSFNPGRFEYGTFFIYTLVPILSLAFLLIASRGAIISVDDIVVSDSYFQLATYEHPMFFVAGRAWVAFLGAATVVLVYFIGRRIGGSKTGLIAALLLALFPAHSLHSHFATTDVPATFVAASVLFIVSYRSLMIRKVGPFLAGVVTGLGISTKYSLAPLMLLPLMGTTLGQEEADSPYWLRLSLVPAGVISGFLLGTPFVLTSYPQFLDTLAWQMRVYNPSQVTVGKGAAWLLLNDLGQLNVLILVIPALLGLVLLLRDKARLCLLLLIFPAGLVLSVASQTVYYSRNLLPVVPFLVIPAALSFNQLWNTRERWAGAAALWLGILLLGLYVGAGLYFVVGDDLRLRDKDVRALALEGALEIVPQGSKVGLDLGTFMPPPNRWEAQRFIYLGSQSVEAYHAQGFDYLMMSEPIFSNPNLPVPVASNHRELRNHAELVETYQGPYYNRPERQIWLYRLR